MFIRLNEKGPLYWRPLLVVLLSHSRLLTSTRHTTDTLPCQLCTFSTPLAFAMNTVEPLPMTVSSSSSAEMASATQAPPLASSLPPPPPPPDAAAAVHPLSESQFRQRLLTTLQTSGTLTSLKTQLKSSIIQQLIQRKLPALLASNNPPPAVQRPLVERLANSLILDHLLALSYTYTHSLFIAELGANNKEEIVFTQHDTLDLLHISHTTATGQQLMTALSHLQPSADANKPTASILLALLSTLHNHTAPTTADTAVQTESSLSDSLEQKLKAVDDELNHTLLYSHPSFSLALEQRMAKVARETNDRAQRDIEQQVAHYKQAELADVRRDERDKYQQQLRDMQQQLTSQHSQQLKEYKARLEASEVEWERKVRAMDEERYMGRQRLMEEMDKCKTREAELQRLELLMKREVGVEAEVWKERNGRLESQLSTLAEERRRLEERIVEERRRVEEQLTAQLVQKEEQLRSLREADDQLRVQYDKSIKDNLSLTQQLADTQRQHIAMSSSSSLVAAAEARSTHLQQQLTDQQRLLEYEKSKHADEVKELMWTANVAVERERERGHAMLVKLSNEWKDAYDTLMAEYERVEAERERKVWRERSGGGRAERRPVGVSRRTAWEERRDDEDEAGPSEHDAHLQSSSFGGQREPQRRAASAGSQQQSSPFSAFPPSSHAGHSPVPVLPTFASQHSSAPTATLITITSPPAMPPSAVPSATPMMAVPVAAPASFASPTSPATTVAGSPFPSPTPLDSPLHTTHSPSTDTPLLFTPPPAASRTAFASPSTSLPFPPLMSPGTPMTGWTEVSEEEERRRAVEAVERGREEAKRKEREEREGLTRQQQQQQQEEMDERHRQDREAAEKKVREEREAKLRQEEERRKQREEQATRDEADREAAAAAAEARKAAHEQEERERVAREETEERERVEREQREEREREETEDREREEREQRELAEVRLLQEKRERQERNERRRTEREEQRAEEERRRLEEEERQLQATMTDEERREEEQREQRRRQQRQEADERARQAAQQRSVQAAAQPAAAIEEEDEYEEEEEDEATRKEREKKARMDEFLKRAKERRDKDRQAEKEEAERKKREAEEAEERRLQVNVRRKDAEVDEDIVEEELEVEAADEAYTGDEFDAPSESAIADEVEIEAGDEIEEDIEL